MKKLFLFAFVCLLVVAMAAPSYAQKMSISVGPDILLPVGNFKDAYSIGFGGTARGQYDFTPMVSGGLEAGYFTWSGKSDNLPAGVSAPSFHGIPIRVFGKYYFMPAEGKARFYGMAELGLFFWSSSVNIPAVVTPFGTFGGGSASASGSDFNLAPVVGVELPVGSVHLDISVRYDMILTSGNSTSNIGGRVGVNFPIGK